MRKLAIDLGQKSMGLAISDITNTISIGLANYFFNDYDLNVIINKLNFTLNSFNDIDLIIFGYPTLNSGRKVPISSWIEKVIFEIKKPNVLVYLPKIITLNENGTTKLAFEIMTNNKVSKNLQKNKKDQVAAQIILQTYLDFYLK